MLLTQNDPFRDLEVFFKGARAGATTSPMAMDAYRRGDDVWVHIDLPGVVQESIEVSVDRSVLTISAHREWQPQDGDQHYLSERRQGSFRRQVHLGDSLDTDGIEADFARGVLTLRLPVSARAKPRRIEIGAKIPEAIDAVSLE